jgi:acyl carrier protein
MNLSPTFFDHVTFSAKVLAALTLVVGLALSWRSVHRRDARARKRAANHMAKNPALNPAAFAATYFPADQVTTARRLRELLVPHLEIDLARIHPDDRLVTDLRMDALDSMSTVEFLLSIEKEFSIKLPEAEVAHILTLRDLSACVARLLAERATRPPGPPSPCQ